MKTNNIIKLTGLILIVALSATSITAQDKVVDQIVAVVGKNIILKSDIEGMYQQQQAQGITTEGDMKCEILENLLYQVLQWFIISVGIPGMDKRSSQ